MTAAELRAALADLEWSQAELATRIAAHRNTVSAWMTGKARIPGAVAAYVSLARQVKALLA